ncbi:MAG: hypothetical protein WAN81_19730, partial [Candidatus Binataceae bacterium]
MELRIRAAEALEAPVCPREAFTGIAEISAARCTASPAGGLISATTTTAIVASAATIHRIRAGPGLRKRAGSDMASGNGTTAGDGG